MARSDQVREIICADVSLKGSDKLAAITDVSKIKPIQLDGSSREGLVALLKQGADAVIDLLPLPFMATAFEAALDARVPLVSTNYGKPIHHLHEPAKAAGVSLMPECGLDPGIDLVICGHAVRQFDELHVLNSYCGGVPEKRACTNSLNYSHADPDMAVQFQVRYYPESGHARISIVVEKCSDQGSDGGVVYDVVIQRGHARREIVFEQKDVRHCDLMRWRKVFFLGAGGEPAQVNPRMDVEAIIAAAVIPPYDTSLQVPEKAIADYDARWQKTPKGINHHGLYRASMPDTGGHDDRGLLPRWVAMYLMSLDPRLREAVIGADEMSGNAGIHARTARTGRIETQDARPLLWLADERAGNWGTERWRGVWQKGREIQKPAPLRTAEKIKSVFIPDLARANCTPRCFPHSCGSTPTAEAPHNQAWQARASPTRPRPASVCC